MKKIRAAALSVSLFFLSYPTYVFSGCVGDDIVCKRDNLAYVFSVFYAVVILAILASSFVVAWLVIYFFRKYRRRSAECPKNLRRD